MNKLYLYLSRRDKQGIKIIKIISTPSECYPTRVPNIKSLHLSPRIEQEITEIVLLHRMDYELCIETAKDFNDLRKSLINRGYRNIGLHEPITNPESAIQIVDKIPKPYVIKTSNKPKIMMKRGKKYG